MDSALTDSQRQDQMRRDEHGVIVCERCGDKVKWGWVYGAGGITLATCGKTECLPSDPRWKKGLRFV